MTEPDFDLVEGFEWDEGNTRKNADKHDVGQAEAEQMFFNEPLLVMDDVKHSEIEPRLHAMGKTDAGRLLHVTFMLRHEGKRIRVISARDMSRKERAYYAKES
jgi:uncharacterized DUF497 family protein